MGAALSNNNRMLMRLGIPTRLSIIVAAMIGDWCIEAHAASILGVRRSLDPLAVVAKRRRPLLSGLTPARPGAVLRARTWTPSCGHSWTTMALPRLALRAFFFRLFRARFWNTQFGSVLVHNVRGHVGRVAQRRSASRFAVGASLSAPSSRPIHVVGTGTNCPNSLQWTAR